MAIKENVLPLAQDSGSGYIRTVSSGGVSQRTAFDTVKGAITADMDEAIADEVDAREAADNQLQTEIDGKVDKVTGKGLSTNDFTNALKTKLDGIEAGAEVNIIETVKVNGTALVPDANRAVNVPAPTVDSALSTTSENPVQNKVITGAVNDLKEDITLVDTFVDSLSDRIRTFITLDWQNKTGFYKKDKTFAQYTTYQVRGVTINVNAGDDFLITSNSYYEMARVVFFDNADNVVDVVWSSNDNTLQENTKVRTPQNATTMLIQAVGNAYQNAIVIKLGNYNVYIDDSTVYHGEYSIEDVIDDNFIATYTDVTNTLTFEDKTGYYDKNGGFSTYSGIKGATKNVSYGEKYLLTSKSFYSMARAVFFDPNNTFIGSVWSSNDSALYTDTPVTVPENASTMLIQRQGANIVELKKMSGVNIRVGSVLRGKNVTVIGDSITEHNWRASTNWAMYIASWCGAIIQNLGASGTGFVKDSPYINRIPNIQENPDIIGVALSWNDMSAGLPIGDVTDTGTTSLCGYANDFFDALITAYPNVPIICYVQNVWSVYRYGVSNSDNWFNKLSEICALKSIPFYGDMYKGSVLRPWNATNRTMYFTSDGSGHEPTENTEHPNSEGHKAIARYLYPKFVDNLVTTGLDYNRV